MISDIDVFLYMAQNLVLLATIVKTHQLAMVEAHPLAMAITSVGSFGASPL